MLSFVFQNINGAFFLTGTPVNILRGTLFIVFWLLKTLFLLPFTGFVGITSPALILCHFDLQKHHWYFGFKFLAFVELFYYLF